MDIGSKAGYPASALSNFSPHPFEIDLGAWIKKLRALGLDEFAQKLADKGNDGDIERHFVCNSMEGFLQGMKFDKPHIQAEVFKLVGFTAKKRGSARTKHWQQRQTLWFQGVPMKRQGDEYQAILDLAYEALAENDSFKAALLASQKATLTHSMGRTKEQETVLTIREFCGRLTRIRADLQKK